MTLDQSPDLSELRLIEPQNGGLPAHRDYGLNPCNGCRRFSVMPNTSSPPETAVIAMMRNENNFLL